MSKNDMNIDLVRSAIDFIEKRAAELICSLDKQDDGFDFEDDDICPSDAFENFHNAMAIYARQFYAYESDAKNGYGRLNVYVIPEGE